MSKQTRMLILSASAGNGHVRAAEALTQHAETIDTIHEVRHIDSLQFTNRVFQDLYAKLYIEAVKKAPILWGWAFDETDVPWRKDKARMMMQRLNAQPLVNQILEFEPDVCICTHFLPADIISHLIKDDRIDTNLSIVVTDFYVHATWLRPYFSRYFLAKPECGIQMQQLGFPDERLSITGIPIHREFGIDADRAALLEKHGMRPDIPIVLLSAGAFGVTSAEDILHMLRGIESPVQIPIICGRNENLQKDLEKFASQHQKKFPIFKILGFTKEMHEWMHLADLFIGKPGGLTTSECLACGLPMVIWHPIPGQEVYNSNYLLENGAAVTPDTASTLGYKVDQLLKDPQRLESMQQQARKLAHPNAAQDILETILEKPNEIPVKVSKRRA